MYLWNEVAASQFGTVRSHLAAPRRFLHPNDRLNLTFTPFNRYIQYYLSKNIKIIYLTFSEINFVIVQMFTLS